MKDDSDARGFKQPSEKALELARAIRRARGEMGQVRFAEVLGRVQSVVSQWENGKSTPSIETLAAVEERLGLPLGTLAAEAGYFTAEAAAMVGFSGAPLVRRHTGRLRDALRLVRAADDLGFGVRLRTLGPAGGEDALWLVEVLPADDEPAHGHLGEVMAGAVQG